MQAQLNERPPVPAPGMPPEVAAQLQSLREEARTLQEERVKLHAELARLQQAMQGLQTPTGDEVGAAVAVAVASARQQWDLELQQQMQRYGCWMLLGSGLRALACMCAHLQGGCRLQVWLRGLAPMTLSKIGFCRDLWPGRPRCIHVRTDVSSNISAAADAHAVHCASL